MSRVLLTGAGGAAAIGVTRSLAAALGSLGPNDEVRRHVLIGVDSDPYHLLRAETEHTYLVPPVGTDEYVPVMRQIIREERIEFVHAQHDDEVRWLASFPSTVAPAKLFLPSPEVVSACQDKFASYRAWKRAGLVVPRTFCPRNGREVADAWFTLAESAWVRPRQGAGGRGARAFSDNDLLEAVVDYIADAAQNWGHWTMAARLSNRSTTWMSLWHRGRLLVAQGRERLSWEGNSGTSHVTGSTGVGMTVSDPVLDRIAQAAVLAIEPQPHGLFGVDLTYDADGIPNPTEINVGRFFTTIDFFTQAGLNLPDLYVQYGMIDTEPLPADERRTLLNPLPPGKLWIRGMDVQPVLSSEQAVRFVRDQLAQHTGSLGSGEKP